MSSRPAPLANAAIPWRAVFVYYVFLTFLSALLALPLAATLFAQGFADRPTGDAALFAPGGYYLLEALRLGYAELLGSIKVFSWGLVVSVVLAPLPLGILLHNLKQPALPLHRAVASALDGYVRLFLLSAVGLLVQAVIVLLSVAGAQALRAWVSDELATMAGDIATLGGLLVGAFLFWLVRIATDLARARAVHGQTFSSDCWRLAGSVLRRAPARVLAAWAMPALLFVFAWLGAAIATNYLHVELAGAWRPWAVLTVHQLTIGVACVTEAIWQRSALRLTLG